MKWTAAWVVLALAVGGPRLHAGPVVWDRTAAEALLRDLRRAEREGSVLEAEGRRIAAELEAVRGRLEADRDPDPQALEAAAEALRRALDWQARAEAWRASAVRILSDGTRFRAAGWAADCPQEPQWAHDLCFAINAAIDILTAKVQAVIRAIEAVAKAIEAVANLVNSILELIRSHGRWKLQGRLDLDLVDDFIRRSRDGFTIWFARGFIERLRNALWRLWGPEEFVDHLHNFGRAFGALGHKFADFAKYFIQWIEGWDPEKDVYSKGLLTYIFPTETGWVERVACRILPCERNPDRGERVRWFRDVYAGTESLFPLWDGPETERRIEQALADELGRAVIREGASEREVTLAVADAMRLMKVRANQRRNEKTIAAIEKEFAVRMSQGELNPEEYVNLQLHAQMVQAQAAVEGTNAVSVLAEEALDRRLRRLTSGSVAPALAQAAGEASIRAAEAMPVDDRLSGTARGAAALRPSDPWRGGPP